MFTVDIDLNCDGMHNAHYLDIMNVEVLRPIVIESSLVFFQPLNCTCILLNTVTNFNILRGN
jgi:hypothetical protein